MDAGTCKDCKSLVEAAPDQHKNKMWVWHCTDEKCKHNAPVECPRYFSPNWVDIRRELLL